jgi:hypothetical protein
MEMLEILKIVETHTGWKAQNYRDMYNLDIPKVTVSVTYR